MKRRNFLMGTVAAPLVPVAVISSSLLDTPDPLPDASAGVDFTNAWAHYTPLTSFPIIRKSI